jgi:hypothetical protein
MLATVSYSYKAAVWGGNTVAAVNWGTFDVQYGSTATGPWTTFATVTNEPQLGNACISKSHDIALPLGNTFIRFRSTWQSGDYYLNYDNLVITQVAAVTCSGTPNAGTASISNASGCSGVNFTLSATNLTVGTGITYQWQSSPTGASPWTDIVGANASTLTNPATSTTYYRLVTTCSNATINNTNVVSYTPSGLGCAGACPINIPSVPVTNQSLICNPNALPGALNATNVTSICGTATTNYMGGQDAIYTFTPSTSGDYTISYNGQTWSSIFVYSDACPASGGICVGSVGTSASSQSMVVTLTAGVQYFIWFDTWPTPNSPCPGTFSISAPPAPCTATTVTLNMTDSWGDGWENAQFRLQETGGTIYGPYTLANGTSGTQSICLPNGCYRVILTEGNTPSEIGWSLTNGSTTYASAVAPNAAPFNTLFTIGGATCPTAPTGDLCADAPIIDLGVNANQTYTGTGIGSTNTIGLTQYSETWVRIVVPCNGINLSLNFCNSTPAINNAYINLFSTCAANPTLTGATNWDFTSCANGSITLNWNNVAAGTYYYPILIDNIQWPGAFTLNVNGIFSPTPTGSSTQSFCSSDNPSIASLVVSGTTIKWYSTATGGNALPTTLGLSNGATYYASQTINSIESACRLAVTVNINPVGVSPGITGATNLCWDGTTTLTPEYPTGGTVTDAGGYRTHTFTSSGTLIVPAGFSGGAEVLVIGGGGGGGSGRGGGGGAGGLLFNSNLNLTASTSYPVTIGAGGAAETNGSNSVFSNLNAVGGGRGGSHDGNSAVITNNGQNGGSGGGAAINYNSNIFTGGAATAGQGNNGATSGSAGIDNPRNTGGGGGASEAGRAGSGGNATWTTGTAPKGGEGLFFPQFSTITGSPLGWFAGGGGGSRGGSDRQGAPAGTGGQGGGGAGQSTSVGTAGIANTGGGGGGSESTGGAGGLGIVIVRYYIGNATWSSQNNAFATVSNGVVAGVAPGGSTSIDYTIASVGGCPSTTVTVPINVIGGQRIAPLGPQCSGTELNFEALPNPSASGTTITWSIVTPSGITASASSGSSNLFSTTFTNSTSGGLTPTVTITQTIGGLTCVRNFTPTINTQLIPTFIALGTYCVGASPASLSNTSSNGITGTWFPAVISTSSSGTTNYVFTPSSTAACETTANTNVVVNPTPTVSLNCPATCAGVATNITATPSPTDTYSYNWTVLPGGVSNPGNVASINTSTVGTYTVIATNTTTNCPSAAISCTVSVQNLPSINGISPP